MNATNKAGEVWTEESTREGFTTWHHYQDADGHEYQSKEQPAYRINMNNAHITPHGIAPITTRPWRGVFVEGPQSGRNRDGDEVPEWTVCVGDEEAEPQGKVYFVSTRSAARRLGEIMARDRSLELIDESTAA